MGERNKGMDRGEEEKPSSRKWKENLTLGLGRRKTCGLQFPETFIKKVEGEPNSAKEKNLWFVVCLNLIREAFKIVQHFYLQIVRILSQLKFLVALNKYRACSKISTLLEKFCTTLKCIFSHFKYL